MKAAKIIGTLSALAVLLLLGRAPLYSSDAALGEKPKIRIPRVSRPPRISDFLEGKEREAELRITEFRQREPNDGQPATRATTAYLSYDDKNLYAVFICKEEPGKVRAHMSRREDLSGDDAVSLSLDTFHDGRRAYEFFANPLGVQSDAISTEGRPDDDFSFDTLWHSDGRLTADGYTVLIAIPFKSLRFSRASGSTWGIALGRWIARNRELSTWPHLTERIEAYVPQFATLEAPAKVSPGRNVQLIPYGFFAQQRFLNAPAGGAPAFQRQTEWRGGLDAKLVLRDALTLDVTLNPDFSQVESDEPQVTINQRYAVFFPEKRPFFTESAGFFETPETLFYSRRIIDPQFGARLTTKAGRWTIGALAMDDRAPGRLLPATDPRHGDHAKIVVARVQRELARESNFGVMFTRRQFGSSSSQVVSLDTRLKLNPNWILTGQAVRSTTRGLEGGHSTGSAYFAELRHAGRHFNYSTTYRDRSPDFSGDDLGFIPRLDIRQVKNVVSYRWRPETGKLVSSGPTIVTQMNWNRQGRLQDWSVDTPFWFQLKGPTTFGIGRVEAFELFQNRGFRKRSNYLYFSTQRLKWLGLTASYTRGTDINFFPAARVAPFLANSTEGTFTLTLRPTARARLEETYVYSRLAGPQAGRPAGVSPSATIFDNHLLRTKLSYQFSRRLSLRAIVDYNAVLANASLVNLERSKRVTADLLFTYLVNPGTAVYIGYSDRFENLALDPSAPAGLGRVGFPGLSTGRQFFIKVSYLLRF